MACKRSAVRSRLVPPISRYLQKDQEVHVTNFRSGAAKKGGKLQGPQVGNGRRRAKRTTNSAKTPHRETWKDKSDARKRVLVRSRPEILAYLIPQCWDITKTVATKRAIAAANHFHVHEKFLDLAVLGIGIGEGYLRFENERYRPTRRGLELCKSMIDKFPELKSGHDTLKARLDAVRYENYMARLERERVKNSRLQDPPASLAQR